jgi:hypothetical protein
MLWSMAMGPQHESIAHLTYEILIELSPSLNTQQLELIVRCWERKAFTDYDSQLVNCIARITRQAYRNAGDAAPATTEADLKSPIDRRWFGLTILWRLIQAADSHNVAIAAVSSVSTHAVVGGAAQAAGSSPVSPSDISNKVISPHVAQEALTQFLQLLATNYALPQRPFYLDRCVANLQNSINVAQSLKLLQQILSTYPKATRGWFGSIPHSRSGIIEDMETKWNLLDHVLQDLEMYKTQLHSVLTADTEPVLSSSPPSFVRSTSGSISSNPSPLVLACEQISVRQDFLVFILSNSSLMLTRLQLINLWNMLVTRAISTTETDTFFDWLTRACQGQMSAAANAALQPKLGTSLPDANAARLPIKAVADDDLVFLYDTKIVMLPPATLTPIGYSLLQTFFLHVNTKRGAFTLDVDPSSSPSSVMPLFIMGDYKAVRGLELLWQVVLQNPRTSIARRSVLLLTRVHGAGWSGLDTALVNAANLSAKRKAALKVGNGLRDSLVDACLLRLASALAVSDGYGRSQVAASQETRVAQLTVLRCISLLKSFLYSFGAHNNALELTINVDAQRDFRLPPFTITLDASATIEDLRTEVHAKIVALQANAGLVKASVLLSRGTDQLVHDTLALRRLGFSAHVPTDVCARRPHAGVQRAFIPLTAAASSSEVLPVGYIS